MRIWFVLKSLQSWLAPTVPSRLPLLRFTEEVSSFYFKTPRVRDFLFQSRSVFKSVPRCDLPHFFWWADYCWLQHVSCFAFGAAALCIVADWLGIPEDDLITLLHSEYDAIAAHLSCPSQNSLFFFLKKDVCVRCMIYLSHESLVQLRVLACLFNFNKCFAVFISELTVVRAWS